MKIWLDTDIGPDCDDTAALGILLELCHRGFGELACVTHCTSSPWGVPVIDLITGIDDVHVPVGTCKRRGFLEEGPSQRYTKPLMQQYGLLSPDRDAQANALDTARSLLRTAAEHEITLIAIGPLNNIAACFQDEELRGLMNAKLERIVVMGGCFEREQVFPEWNIQMDIPAAKLVTETFDGSICFAPFEAAENILVGNCLRKWTDHPIEISYRLYTEGGYLRPSWDLVAVYAAMRGANALISSSPNGVVSINEDGVTIFREAKRGKATYLRSPSLQLVDELESLLDCFCGRTQANAMQRLR